MVFKVSWVGYLVSDASLFYFTYRDRRNQADCSSSCLHWSISLLPWRFPILKPTNRRWIQCVPRYRNRSPATILAHIYTFYASLNDLSIIGFFPSKRGIDTSLFTGKPTVATKTSKNSSFLRGNLRGPFSQFNEWTSASRVTQTYVSFVLPVFFYELVKNENHMHQSPPPGWVLLTCGESHRYRSQAEKKNWK